MLRRHERFVRACAGMGLALVALLAVGSSTALAASEELKPKPQPLWEAFPLNPTDKRLGSVYQPPAQGRPEALKVTKAEETPTQASRTNVTMLALFAGAALLALALVGFASMRRLSVRNHRRNPVAAWKEISWSNPADSTQGLRERRAEQSVAAAVGVEHRAAGLHPDVPASAYRLQKLERRPLRRSRVTGRGRRAPSSRVLADGLAGVARRVKAVVWTEQTAPVIIGAALAVVASFLIIQWVG